MSKVFAFLNRQDGVSPAEYALALAVVGAAIGAAGNFLGSFLGASAGVINDAAICIHTHSHVAACLGHALRL